MKIKQTWLYKKLQKFQNQPIIAIDDLNHCGTILVLLNMILVPIIAMGVTILVILLGTVSLPFYIIKDLYDWYIRANYEKIALKKFLKEQKEKETILNNVELALNKYGDSLLKKHGTYHLLVHNNDIALYGFLLKFFKEYNDVYKTYNKSNKIVCNTGKRRSLGDLYLICKNYFPNCTTYQVFKELIKLSNNNKISYSRCSTINKYVFYENIYNHNDSSSNSHVEYFDSKIMFYELLKNLK